MGGEHRTFALRLVQKPSFVELDVLEFGAHDAAHDDLYLLRDTESQCTEEIRGSTDLRRILYASAGLAMLLLACEQGERLDWWRSGVFNGLFAGGSFFLLCALVRRLRGPNPLVALPYLLKWNTVLLGSLLFLLPLHSLHDHHSGAAGAGHPRF